LPGLRVATGDGFPLGHLMGSDTRVELAERRRPFGPSPVELRREADGLSLGVGEEGAASGDDERPGQGHPAEEPNPGAAPDAAPLPLPLGFEKHLELIGHHPHRRPAQRVGIHPATERRAQYLAR
jgi:hypothetical protein